MSTLHFRRLHIHVKAWKFDRSVLINTNALFKYFLFDVWKVPEAPKAKTYHDSGIQSFKRSLEAWLSVKKQLLNKTKNIKKIKGLASQSWL